MRKLIYSTLFLMACLSGFTQSESCENKLHPMPVLSDSVKKVFQKNLISAESKYNNDNSNADLIIWYGRRTAYLGHYKESIAIFSKGISLYPENSRFYRHRGHRYISLRCFDRAISDLKKASELIGGQIDEIEPDGIPNAANIPTSTLHSNIWYHLGLAYYLKEEYRNALLAFEKCMSVSDNDDMLVATLNWLNITLRKMGRISDAEERLNAMSSAPTILENQDYYDILLMYKSGDDSKLAEKTKNQVSLSNSTLGFALGTFYLLNGNKQQAKELFEKVVSGNQWASFGFIAAEAELARMK